MTGYICDQCTKTKPLEYSVTSQAGHHLPRPAGWYLVDSSSGSFLLCDGQCLKAWVKSLEKAT